MAGILIHNINDCLKLRQTYLIELVKEKRIKCHRLQFERNSVQTYGNCLHLRANDVNSGPFSVYRCGYATPQPFY